MLRNCLKYVLPLLCVCSPFAQAESRSVVIKWGGLSGPGAIEVRNAKLDELKAIGGKGSVVGKDGFEPSSPASPLDLQVSIDEAMVEPGPLATVVTVKAGVQSFSFFLRDVTAECPIYIPEHKVIVSTEADSRSYAEIEGVLRARRLLTKAQQAESEPEASFESVAPATRNMSCPVWLGLGRDVRLFEIEEEMNDNISEGKNIRPLFASKGIPAEEMRGDELHFFYAFGKGVGTRPAVTRSLDEGYLPIYHSELTDDDICYHSVSFVTGEEQDLSSYDACGSNYLLFDHYSKARQLTDAQQEAIRGALQKDSLREGAVLCIQTTIRNNGKVPRYAWFIVPRPGNGWMKQYPHTYDREKGLSSFPDGKVFCSARLNGKPVPNEEMAILLQPGEEAECQFLLPHCPVPMERGEAMASRDYSGHYAAAKRYWQAQTESAARVHVPERRIDEMLKAGLHHLNLITYGDNRTDVYAPTIGVYHPVGTESAPIILYYLSMGWQETAKRSLNYFLAWQQADGSIQNFGGYMVETGAFLWAAGEYVRYTKDTEWVKGHKGQLLLACKNLLDKRAENMADSLRGRGYGMVDGKFADVFAPYRQFSVNAYNYLGLSRMAEMLEPVDPEESARIGKAAREWKRDILESLARQLEITPVVPLGDGTWTSNVSPWAEGKALRALYYEPETYWSHGTFIDSDILSGPHYLVFCEVVDPQSDLCRHILDYTREVFCQGLTASSQPYYSRHNWMQLQRGEVKPFLNTYYSTMSAIADRQTYSFWEHLYRCSPHKTHEEATFLMNTRWMLYLETGDTLSVFKAIPRKWLEDGKEIALKGAGSYFGALDITAKSDLKNRRIAASVSCEDLSRKPKCVIIRLPHPEGLPPTKVTGGEYRPQDESVVINGFTGKAEVAIQY